MKKTFITAALGLALAASANAEVVKAWVAPENQTGLLTLTVPANTITDTAEGHFTLTAVLNADAVKEAVEGNQWGIFLKIQDGPDHDANNSHYSFNLALNGYYNNNNDGFYTGLGTAASTGLGNDFTNGLGQAYARGTDFTSIAISMAIGGNGVKFYLTTIDVNGNVSNYNAASADSWHYSSFDLTRIIYNPGLVSYLALDEDYITDSTAGYAANAAAIKAYDAIPEPATATLSLLALAGLATRRRRK